MNLIPTNLNIDFLKMSKPMVWVSTLLVIASFVGIFTKGLNYGIDFKGGAEVQIRVAQGWTIGSVRGALEEGGLKELSVVQIGKPEDREFLIKVPASASEAIKTVGETVEKILKPKMEGFQLMRVDMVGPKAGESLQIDALMSLIYAAIGILIYITFRFDSRFAPGMIRALFFDVIITMGIWVLLQKEFNLGTIAALLTIAGYSCNDTIVIYDRIRDHMKMHPEWSIEKIINTSINVNLGRTIITTMTTCFVLLSIWMLGGSVLSDFALVMLIGFTSGVLSTIFVANYMVLKMEQRRLARLGASVKT
jgi:preprotein translocase subunit SecF